MNNGTQYVISASVQNADTVRLERKSGDSWVYVLEFNPVGNNQWTLSAYLPSGEYRIYAIGGTGSNQKSGSYSLGELSGGTVSPEISGYIQTLVNYITQFVDAVGDFFDWLPVEIRTVLVSCIIIMIVLGLIGWLKN